MTEYDSSPEAYHQFQRTQQRISNWADDTAHCASQYKSPFLPRSDVHNNFYNPRSASSSRSPPPSGHHSGRSSPHGSNSHGHPSAHKTGVRSPLRSQTISVVSPNDSISQVSGPSHRTSRRRAQSHSPTRNHSPSSRSSRSHHRSHHRSPPPTATYAPAPQYTVQYGTQYPNYSVQYANPAPVQYVQPQPGGYTVVYPSDRKIQIVYPPAAHPTQEHHSGGLLRRIFGSQSGKHERSRSLSHSRR
ncbi:hypothetical protein C8R45DRAFT_1221713 [Mycena sanguinolenta]|nr:hypothetical protein C8R45DRAFT_1221713 [Mycena sanguinolenta]